MAWRRSQHTAHTDAIISAGVAMARAGNYPERSSAAERPETDRFHRKKDLAEI